MISPSLILCLLTVGASYTVAAPIAGTENDLPSRAIEAATPAGTLTGVVTASPSSSILEYISPITINGTVYNVLLDTGSDSLWIKGQGSGSRWSVNYTSSPSSTVSGTIQYGTVTVGGMTLTNQSYGLADSYPSSYASGWDGILGLGPAATHLGSNNTSWLHNIMPQLQQPIFAVDMIPRSSSSHYTFGYAETSHEKTAPASIPADLSKGYWGLTVDRWGVSTGDVSNTACIVNTGTALNYVPVSVAQGYWGTVQGASTTDGHSWTYPCGTTLPDFKPTIHGYQFIVAGNYSQFGSETTGTCKGSIVGSSNCALGQYFIMDQYIVFDYGNQQMQMAQRI